MIVEKFQELLREMVRTQLPDLHIVSGARPYVRRHNGDIIEVSTFDELSIDHVAEIIREMTGIDRFDRYQTRFDDDLSYSIDDHRFRVNIFHDSHGYSIAIRYIPVDIPTWQSLSIPENVMQILHRGKGLILVTGPTGSGKSTTLAAMIEYINENFCRHIITIEDPIEFRFSSKKSLVNQREVGTHCESFARAMKSCLREDPDVIMVGEMRDPETVSAAITLAETGHLVISTLHTNDTVQSIDRVIDAFPAVQQNQIRSQLALCLSCVISQILLPNKTGEWRVVAREILMNTDAVRSVIIRGVTSQLYSILEISSQDGMVLMDQALEKLYLSGKISKELFASRVRDTTIVGHYF